MDSSGRMVLYVFGMLLVIGGLAYAALALGVPAIWIGIGAVVLLGFAIAGAASKARGDRTTVREPVAGHTEIHHHH
jgi:hypothetical protein